LLQTRSALVANLDGRTRRRDRVLERFKTGDDPVSENQAVDRAHRIGQTVR
jgi:SNF2 family DNA or RNA helicase